MALFALKLLVLPANVVTVFFHLWTCILVDLVN